MLTGVLSPRETESQELALPIYAVQQKMIIAQQALATRNISECIFMLTPQNGPLPGNPLSSRTRFLNFFR